MEVQHNTEKKQFQLDLGGQLAYSQYMQVGEKMIFTHTEVPIGFEGQGIASKIARVALDFARENNFKVMPICPYIAGFIQKNPEYKTLLQEGFRVD
ncbi:MAG: GNAT family N-acetyltransferase [Saprospiraceae bacterium]